MSTSVNIGSLRQEHRKLCETVALADKVFSPYLFVVMSLLIPLICFNFHQLFKYSKKDNTSYIITVLYRCMGQSGEVALILVFGIRVNEKVRVRSVIFDKLVFNLPGSFSHSTFLENDPANLRLFEAFYIRKYKPTINSREECSEFADLLF